MRLLLFFVSVLFSSIFYFFYRLSQKENIFGGEVTHSPVFVTITGNIFIETLIFLFLGTLFIFYFSPIRENNNLNKQENRRILYTLFYIFLFLAFISNLFETNVFILGGVLLFIFGDICFTLLSKMKYFSDQKITLRYFGLSLNYMANFISLYYLFNLGFSIFLFSISTFSIVFNYFVHTKYTNYISLFFSIIIFIFLLFFGVFSIYGVLEKILFY